MAVIYLQSGGVDTVQPLDGQGVPLSFRLAPWDVELAFRPLDFIQVNAKLNEKMIAHALDLLEPGEDERVLDLFCGGQLHPAAGAACARWLAWKAMPAWWRVRVRTPSATAWQRVLQRRPDPGPAQHPWMRQGL